MLLSRLEALAVQPERRSGYDRDLFDHWVDADGDRCDARREVLIAEAVVTPRVGASCSLSGGQWYSVYDGATEQGTGRGFDVDHLVPLAEAWDSGAYAWDSATRRRYANDLGYAHSLVAVSASSNRQKGAGDPADWLPPLVSSRCWYAEAWIAVKTRWELSVDSAELAALRSLVSQCQDSQLGSGPAQASPISAASTPEPTPTTTATTPNAADDLCHPAYIPCLPNLTGDALNCGDLSSSQRPVQVREIGVDPYRLDRDGDGFGCTS
ncbi:MAG: HNH endonuclease [Acidimicrobiaceae bacterium]|nr:HNH endonuclease [Acidimicrobiaceae bacterium]MYA75575.1 HNH endonuclease [Acidimicrobiaceae bacterium]MYC43885.1 HNH endonuclease [Acidimicrobiaceae bacterium]MYD08065.1 HNH endonuclease [Acidimicrobiaceae bacterium]MYG56357.1 HNH endonuclease [Acidimicrobiaceae bacterium]